MLSSGLILQIHAAVKTLNQNFPQNIAKCKRCSLTYRYLLPLVREHSQCSKLNPEQTIDPNAAPHHNVRTSSASCWPLNVGGVGQLPEGICSAGCLQKRGGDDFWNRTESAKVFAWEKILREPSGKGSITLDCAEKNLIIGKVLNSSSVSVPRRFLIW